MERHQIIDTAVAEVLSTLSKEDLNALVDASKPIQELSDKLKDKKLWEESYVLSSVNFYSILEAIFKIYYKTE